MSDREAYGDPLAANELRFASRRLHMATVRGELDPFGCEGSLHLAHRVRRLPDRRSVRRGAPGNHRSDGQDRGTGN